MIDWLWLRNFLEQELVYVVRGVILASNRLDVCLVNTEVFFQDSGGALIGNHGQQQASDVGQELHSVFDDG
jgi:hypothetical protein